jgi:hypothetical protein
MKKQIPFAAVFCALGLAGCVAGPNWDSINQQAIQLRTGCEAQHSAGTIPTHLATEQCANGPIRNLYVTAKFNDTDVLDAYLARREAIAAQLDRKAVPPEEARAQWAQAQVEMNSEIQRRRSNRAVGAAAAYATFPTICNRVGPGTMICN